MYATTYKTGMWMDFLDVDPSAKKNRVQEPMLPSLHLGPTKNFRFSGSHSPG
jgi:hypothetical protein